MVFGQDYFPLGGGGGYPPIPLSFFKQKDIPLRGYGGGGGYPFNGKNPQSSFWQRPLLPRICLSLELKIPLRDRQWEGDQCCMFLNVANGFFGPLCQPAKGFWLVYKQCENVYASNLMHASIFHAYTHVILTDMVHRRVLHQFMWQLSFQICEMCDIQPACLGGSHLKYAFWWGSLFARARRSV